MSATPPKAPSRFRRVILEVSIGIVLGFVVCSVFGPQLVSWWYAPPSKDAFSCAGTVRGALGQFVQMQLLSALGGGIVLTLLLWLSRRLWKRLTAGKAAPPPAAEAPPPPAPAAPPPA
jgi:hypothetical protein